MGKTEQLLLTDRKTNIGENTPAPKTENCSTNITTLSNSNKLYVDIFLVFYHGACQLIEGAQSVSE